MRTVLNRELPRFCPRNACFMEREASGESPRGGPPPGRRIRKRDSFRRKGSLRRIRRFSCLSCQASFSEATFEPEYRQQRRDLNEEILKLFCSLVSQRRIARHLGVSRGLVSRRLRFLALQAQSQEDASLQVEIECRGPVSEIQFDEMETFEHTKCKPLSIALAVETKSRKILAISVASMPAGGPLARISRFKYGPRADDRGQEAHALFSRMKPWVDRHALIETDQNPKYPGWIKAAFPEARHVTFKGRRSAVVGQGELKKIGRDPLFSLNHTAAMIRANVSRLIRRTWCTTKRPENLRLHLELYRRYHNRELLKAQDPSQME